MCWERLKAGEGDNRGQDVGWHPRLNGHAAAAAAAKSLQSCPTLCDPMDCSLPGSSIHGIFQARVMEWGAIAFSAVDMSLSKFQEILKNRKAWCAEVHEVAESDMTEKLH